MLPVFHSLNKLQAKLQRRLSDMLPNTSNVSQNVILATMEGLDEDKLRDHFIWP